MNILPVDPKSFTRNEFTIMLNLGPILEALLIGKRDLESVLEQTLFCHHIIHYCLISGLHCPSITESVLILQTVFLQNATVFVSNYNPI